MPHLARPSSGRAAPSSLDPALTHPPKSVWAGGCRPIPRAGGALGLYQRARTELSASGGRPRRAALLSGPASLTPSERRIAELAASGHSNREIAANLFVTPKTVEYHLRNAYRKLDIHTRRQLAGALSE